jgi:hypothetical protein
MNGTISAASLPITSASTRSYREPGAVVRPDPGECVSAGAKIPH